MKVLDLRCANGHRFEGWFASEDEFLAQNGARRIECPVCADTVIVKALSAPRLNLGARETSSSGASASRGGPPQAPSQPQPAEAPSMPEPSEALQRQWLQAVRQVVANTEDVGPRFAEEARRIHYGETSQRGIRGHTTPQERDALRDEGIEFATLPMPKGFDTPLQ